MSPHPQTSLSMRPRSRFWTVCKTAIWNRVKTVVVRFTPTRYSSGSTTSTWTVVGWEQRWWCWPAAPDDFSYLVLVEFLAVADRDSEALDVVLNTFNVVGDV